MSRNINKEYEWIGVSSHSEEVMKEIEIAAKNDEYTLITGETGVGKEVVARKLHKLSNRAESRFVPVNCGAIPKELAETEFFGNERGAYTGADSRRVGYIEAADKGILFLDEVGSMPSELQPKILRFLEDGVIVRLGSTMPLETDVRVIAATNEDVYGSSLRRDLFYRLDVNHIHVKPLRERREDIMPVAEFYLSLLNQKAESHKTITQEAKSLLEGYEFPGNVRELENILRYGFYHCGNSKIETVHLQPKIDRNRQYAKLSKTG